MEINYLIEYLNNKVDDNCFSNNIEKEILEYINSRINNKGVSNIYGMYSEGSTFNCNNLIQLLNKYLHGGIGEWELEYLLNFIELSVPDNDEKVQKVIFNLSSPEINYPITYSNVLLAIKFLKEEIDDLSFIDNKINILSQYKSIFFNNNSR